MSAMFRPHSGLVFSKASFATLLLVLLLLIRIPMSYGDGTGDIVGTVTDSSTGLGIPDATVYADGYSNTTDAVGHYIISDLAPGPYEVRAIASGYIGESRTATVFPGFTATVDFQLDPLSIAGRVCDASTGVGIAFVNLTADDFATLANSTGHYMFIDLPTGSYTVTAQAPGYASQSEQAPVSPGETAVVDFLLDAVTPGKIEGTVTDSQTGLAIQNALITTHAQWTEGYEVSNTTDQNGDYVLEDVPVWPYWNLGAYALGYSFQSRLVPVTAGSVNVEDFVLDPLGRLNGTILDASTEQPLVGALVKAQNERAYRNETGGDGQYVIWNVEHGTYTVRASAPGYASDERANIEVHIAETTTVDFELTPVLPGRIEGTVTDIKTGEGLAGVTVTADGYSNTTNVNGYYVLSNVPAWTYTMTASAPEYITEETLRTVPPGETVTANFELNPITRTFVTPYLSYADPGGDFAVSVNIANARLVDGWHFYLRWNATLLNLTEVEEGGFLHGPSESRPTDFDASVYQDEGYMQADCSLIASSNGVNGSGTLANLIFEVEENGECSLVLYFVTLRHPNGMPSIPHEVKSGVFDTLPGDVNNDRVTDIFDLALIGKAWGSTPEDPQWNSRADIDGNGTVNSSDLQIVYKNYGKSSP